MEPESVSKNLPKSDAVLHASGNLSAKGRASKIDKNIDKYIEESKHYVLSKYFKKGFYLDVKDEFNWCVAKIDDATPDNSLLTIYFDNWSTKYNEDLKPTSKKIFPIRYYSVKYTGQKKSTLREYDTDLSKKEMIMQTMDNYAKTQFSCSNEEEIQAMYQFICGECYLYIDSLLTCDEKDAKKDAASIVEVITGFFEMLSEWLKIVPVLTDYLPYMKKYSYLYLVCPDAAIVNLYKSFIPTVDLIFGLTARSSDFMSTSSAILMASNTLPLPKMKKFYQVQVYFLDSFINTKCLKGLTNFIKAVQTNKISDFSIVLSFLSEIAPTFTKVDMKNEDSDEFTKAVNSFLFDQDSSISHKIKLLPAAQVKDINEDEIISVVRAYYDQSDDNMGKELYCAKTQLDLLLSFLQSPYIDKKLTALNEIKKLFEKRNRKGDVPTKILAQWLAE